MNSYDLSRDFFDWSYENTDLIKPTHVALYFFIIEHNNRLGWKDKFGLPTQMTMDAIGILNYKTYAKVFKDLVDWGFIKQYMKSKNQYSATIIGLVKNTKAHTKAYTKALLKHDLKQVQSTDQSIVVIDKPNNLITYEPNNLLTESIKFATIKKYFLGIPYESQKEEILKYSKQQYESYVFFIDMFIEYEEKIKNHDFPTIKIFTEKLLSKYKMSEIEFGVTNLKGYGISHNAHIITKIIICMGWDKSKKTNGVSKTDVNELNELTDYKKVKESYDKPQSFR